MNMQTAMIHPYRNDLKDMSLAHIDGHISVAQDQIDSEESWLEALTAWREVLTTKWYMTGASTTSSGDLARARAEAHPPAIARLQADNTTWSVVGLSRIPMSPTQPAFIVQPTDYMALTAKPEPDIAPAPDPEPTPDPAIAAVPAKRFMPVGIRSEGGMVINANVEDGAVLYVSTDTPLEAIVTAMPEPRGFADWKTRLTELRAELVNLTTILPTALDAPIAIVDELLEGFDDVVETRALLAKPGTLHQRLLAAAEHQMAWDKWELGQLPVPEPLFHKDTAALLREAAQAVQS